LGAASEIPKTNPFLRQLFETITGMALDEEPYAGFVDDLAQLLADMDIDAVLADFGKRTARQDPVVHFYETFLAAYDPKLRESRGVYYTPEPVVSYIVRSVDYLLKTRFGLPNGLADTATVEYEREATVAAMSSSPKAAGGDTGATAEKPTGGQRAPLQKATSPRVLILDPACGTGTFLYAVIDHIRSEFMRQGNAGMWSGYVRNHLLPRIFGFELLMAPYAVAHFKLGMQLAGHDLAPAQREKWAYDFSGDERLGVYLTNTLEEAERKAETLFGPLRVITQEANAASEIKRNMPILAVIGNPPYSGHSANRSWEVKNGKKEPTFIGRLIQDYYKVDGQPLGEKNPKWLQNDYVKFIRWGQWRIGRTGAGVLAFITDHSYLDSPTFRGMRQHLMGAFSDIYILDLHGNGKKQEKCPDGSKDENVFDIQQGVTIGIFVKGGRKADPAKVWHAELWGVRETQNKQGGKYPWLFEHDLADTPWKEVVPQSPLYLFKPRKEELAAEYETGWKTSDVMLSYNMGITTGVDAFAVAFSRSELEERVLDLAGKERDSSIREKYSLEDTSSFSLSDAREWARSPRATSSIVPIGYRCFDSRFVIYSSSVLARSREDICHHLIAGVNRALVTFRAIRKLPWFHAFISDRIATKEYLSTLDNCYVLPQYLYPPGEKNGDQAELTVSTSVWPAGKNGRRPNLNPEFIADLEKRLGLSFVSDGKGDLKNTFGPEDVFNYIYAIFYSPTYRTRYAEFLKSDFPRVPLTSDVELFRSLCGLGGELVALHLLESPKLEKPIARYPVKGGNLVDKGFPKYVAPGDPEPGTGKPVKEGRVYINRPALTRPDKSGHPLPAGEGRAEGEGVGQYFEGIPPEVWNFHIGGYQVCEKWLKDRRGRELTYDDQLHYCKVVTALSETIRLMTEIDAAIPKWLVE
jgi:predicted helicase